MVPIIHFLNKINPINPTSTKREEQNNYEETSDSKNLYLKPFHPQPKQPIIIPHRIRRIKKS
jgi:hypothetical protein